MKAIEFEGVNVRYGKDQPEYQVLPCNKADNGNVICCFELTREELDEIARTGKMWVSMLTFNKPLQPVLLSPFELEHNIPTGGVTYKNLPECEHTLDERNTCTKCNLKFANPE